MDRRDVLRAGALSIAATAAAQVRARTLRDARDRTSLGLVLYTQSFARRARARDGSERDLFDPFVFLERSLELGAGGMQVDIGVLDEARAATLRRRLEEAGLYLEAVVQLPSEERDVERFEAAMRTAARSGARAARTVLLTGRRYEEFHSLDALREHMKLGRRKLELAAPIAERFRLPLAIENHKDQRNDERLDLLRAISNEYVGACVDTGNSLALLEDPIATVEAFAPFAHSVHLKDQALKEYDEGFLLADVPLGRGALDVRRMVEILRQRKPEIRFSLELITRDPLKIPCLTESYWATLPKVPAADLARTLRLVRSRGAKELAEVSSLSLEEQVAREHANVTESLAYARRKLDL